MPGNNGFLAEFLILMSALLNHTGAGLAVLFGVVLSVAHFLGIYRRVFQGPACNTVVENSMDLCRRELVTIIWSCSPASTPKASST